MSNIADQSKLKQLQVRLAKEKAEMEGLKCEQRDISKKIQNCDSKIYNISAEIEEIKDRNKDVIVSEHAIYRYFERCMNMPIDKVKERLLTPEILKNYRLAGNGKYPNNDLGVTLVIKNNVVVTIQ